MNDFSHRRPDGDEADLEMMKEALAEACRIAGNERKLATLLGLRRQAINAWKKRGYAPVDRAKQLQRETGIPAHRFRPDHFDKVGA